MNSGVDTRSLGTIRLALPQKPQNKTFTYTLQSMGGVLDVLIAKMVLTLYNIALFVVIW